MKKGFSLTEILVSIVIISILSGIGIQGFFASRQRARLEEDVSKVVQALRKAQNSALAPSRSETKVGSNETLCAIIFKMESGNIGLFAGSINNNNPLNRNCNVSNSPYLNLDIVKYSSIRFNPSNTIIFDVPLASTTGGSLSLSLDGVTKTITVTNSGLIKVE